jgi:hypothetical protein
MSDALRLLASYEVDVQFPDVSGFEILEMLDIRSRIAACENDLNDEQRTRLEAADDRLLRSAPAFFQSVAAIADLPEMRRRSRTPCSHWWWYLERLAEREPVQT